MKYTLIVTIILSLGCSVQRGADIDTLVAKHPYITKVNQDGNIIYLHLSRDNANNHNIQLFNCVNTIETLSITCAANIDNDVLADILKLPILRHITLTIPRMMVDNNTLRHVFNNDNLEVLSINYMPLSPGSLEGISKLTQLRSLRLFNCNITDLDCEPLLGLKRIEYIDISQNNITESMINRIARFDSLSRLRVADININRDKLDPVIMSKLLF
jgi:Leucine-rich repeat (LRR) protein